jgi:hypothetical protein
MISWCCDLTLSLYRFTIAAYDRSALSGAARLSRFRGHGCVTATIAGSPGSHTAWLA